jgi:tetratricopeptide (TPR) repeat protein
VAGEERSGVRLVDALALVAAEEFDTGASELRELLPDLGGRELLDALIALGRASLLSEHTEEALACAERSLELADQNGDLEMRGPALALLSQVYGQRGDEDDLARALELGDSALEEWVPGSRATDLALHQSLQALTHYWTGRYASAADLGRRGDDGATGALALVGLGRHEEAIDRSDAAIASGREAGSPFTTAYALCCSTAALRDVLDLDEARRRNEEAIELFRDVGFESGVMQGEMDLLYADLAEGEVGRADRSWPKLWARLDDATGWERWLAPGRLSVAHAEISLLQERWDAAEEAALEAIEVALKIGREKYEVSARIVLGSAHVELGHVKDGTAELRMAVAAGDLLGHPPTRWRAHAALARALDAAGDDEAAAETDRTAAAIVRAFASMLRSGHAEQLLRSPAVQELLRS